MNTSLTQSRFVRSLAAVVGITLGALVLASASQAACSYPDAEQVFAPWQDTGYYQLAPDGGLEEGGTGWTLEDGATLVPGNESHYLNGTEDDTSLSLPYGGRATSPSFCVDETTPVFRLMAQNAGKENTKLRVTVIYESPETIELKNKNLVASPEWAPTDTVKLETKKDEERIARISFTSKDPRGIWQIDDLYVDPFSRR